MLMPGRKYSIANTNYRYGFNGKENDNEVKGDGNEQDYGKRIYDSRIVRFLSVDPLTEEYPFYSSYQFASNNPILAIDIDGMESSVKINNVEYKVNRANNAEVNRRTVAEKYGLTPLERANPDIYFGNRQNEAVQSTKTLGKIGLLAGAVALDVFVTKGWATRIVLGYGIINSLSDNPSANPEENQRRSEEFKSSLTNVLLAESLGFLVAKIKIPYSSGRFIIGSKTLAKVTEHLKQFGIKAENTIMLERMEKIANKELKATEIDINFAKHELRESELMKGGKTYEEAHEAVLKEQNMYHRDYEKKLYTEDALKAGNEQLENEVTKPKK